MCIHVFSILFQYRQMVGSNIDISYDSLLTKLEINLNLAHWLERNMNVLMFCFKCKEGRSDSSRLWMPRLWGKGGKWVFNTDNSIATVSSLNEIFKALDEPIYIPLYKNLYFGLSEENNFVLVWFKYLWEKQYPLLKIIVYFVKIDICVFFVW